MPRYDFKCNECGTIVEIAVLNINPPTRPMLCPDCGEPMEKLPAAPNFVVTGFNAKNGYAK